MDNINIQQEYMDAVLANIESLQERMVALEEKLVYVSRKVEYIENTKTKIELHSKLDMILVEVQKINSEIQLLSQKTGNKYGN